MNESMPIPSHQQYDEISDLNTIFLIVLYGIIIVIGLIANLTILINVIGKSKFHKIPQMILLNLITCDLLQTLLSGPYYIYSLSEPPTKSTQATDLCKGYLLFSYTLGYVSIGSMLLISLDRYIAVMHPYFYHDNIGRYKIIFVTILCWALPTIACFPPTVVEDWLDYDGMPGGFCGVQWNNVNKVYVFIVIGFLFAIPTVVIFMTNISVYRIARKKLKAQMTLKHTLTKNKISIEDEQKSSSLTITNSKTHHHNQESSLQFFSTTGQGLPQCTKKLESSKENTTAMTSKSTLRPSSIVMAGRRLGNLPNNVMQRFNGSTRKKVTKKDIQIAVATLLLIGFYLLSWLPFVITRMLKASGVSIPRWLIIYSPVIMFSTVAWDPLLILWCRNEIRRSAFKTVKLAFIKELCFQRNSTRRTQGSNFLETMSESDNNYLPSHTIIQNSFAQQCQVNVIREEEEQSSSSKQATKL